MKHDADGEFAARAKAVELRPAMPPEAPLAMPKQLVERPPHSLVGALVRLIGRLGLPSDPARRGG